MADLDAESDMNSASYLFEWEICTKKNPVDFKFPPGWVTEKQIGPNEIGLICVYILKSESKIIVERCRF